LRLSIELFYHFLFQPKAILMNDLSNFSMFDYPIEIIADIYLSRIGGFSSELDRKEIGINVRAIELNTSIIANETTAKLRFFDEKTKPYFFKESYLIVGLEPHMDGYEYSKNGEVVLSSDLKEDFSKYIGKDVLLNTVESFRIDYRSVIKAFAKRLTWISSESLRRERRKF